MNYTPIENSQRAVFVDAGIAVDQTNYPNMFTSYYTYGGALALALDLQLRKQFNKSLDGFMQQMWKTFGKPEKAYTLPQVQQVLSAYTTPAFASAFFNKQVYGHEPINYNELLQAAGLGLKKTFAGKAWMGNMRYTNDTTKLVISTNTIKNTPLYNAGVDVDDVLLQIDNVKVLQPEEVDAILLKHQPGDTVKLVYKHRNTIIEKNVKLAENPFVTIVPLESSDKTITDAQKEFKRNWIESKAN
jgi:predicted metalloprotease with PDZ domain